MPRKKRKPAPVAPRVEPTTLEVDFVAQHVYRVKLKDCAEVELVALDEADAVERYKRYCGILDTEHTFAVSHVEAKCCPPLYQQ